MNIFSIYAYDDPRSFGAAMHNRCLRTLEALGHEVRVADLYAEGFRATPVKWDFVTSSTEHADYMLEQKRSAARGPEAFSEDIRTHIEGVRAADCIIIEFPLWWSAPPAIVKGWIDKVFAMGIAWDNDRRYAKGLLRGKRVLVVVGVDDDEATYQPNGIHKATVMQHLYPLLHSTLAQAGLDVLSPFIACGLARRDENDQREYLDNLEHHIQSLLEKPRFIYQHE